MCDTPPWSAGAGVVIHNPTPSQPMNGTHVYPSSQEYSHIASYGRSTQQQQQQQPQHSQAPPSNMSLSGPQVAMNVKKLSPYNYSEDQRQHYQRHETYPHMLPSAPSAQWRDYLASSTSAPASASAAPVSSEVESSAINHGSVTASVHAKPHGPDHPTPPPTISPPDSNHPMGLNDEMALLTPRRSRNQSAEENIHLHGHPSRIESQQENLRSNPAGLALSMVAASSITPKREDTLATTLPAQVAYSSYGAVPVMPYSNPYAYAYPYPSPQNSHGAAPAAAAVFEPVDLFKPQPPPIWAASTEMGSSTAAKTSATTSGNAVTASSAMHVMTPNVSAPLTAKMPYLMSMPPLPFNSAINGTGHPHLHSRDHVQNSMNSNDGASTAPYHDTPGVAAPLPHPHSQPRVALPSKSYHTSHASYPRAYPNGLLDSAPDASGAQSNFDAKARTGPSSMATTPILATTLPADAPISVPSLASSVNNGTVPTYGIPPAPPAPTVTTKGQEPTSYTTGHGLAGLPPLPLALDIPLSDLAPPPVGTMDMNSMTNVAMGMAMKMPGASSYETSRYTPYSSQRGSGNSDGNAAPGYLLHNDNNGISGAPGTGSSGGSLNPSSMSHTVANLNNAHSTSYRSFQGAANAGQVPYYPTPSPGPANNAAAAGGQVSGSVNTTNTTALSLPMATYGTAPSSASSSSASLSAPATGHHGVHAAAPDVHIVLTAAPHEPRFRCFCVGLTHSSGTSKLVAVEWARSHALLWIVRSYISVCR
ncbi:hypothetical protein CXG81DRAFT_19657 [Caulochytrium protostelioides]|uniref:Uncharacterized protein n=1 Tax=Caulochytrium protostelioides TaxID=1555241 RepID=A0A4P9X5U9_9FUNG|nr:hypothetical protein CXG81DRAFT_19657 [Caulochytrium protostelioides]|eukprot:RKP00380.1 hypothetical protein CXG81DRAFT_19657 [Caulochytrium protostelioides]